MINKKQHVDHKMMMMSTTTRRQENNYLPPSKRAQQTKRIKNKKLKSPTPNRARLTERALRLQMRNQSKEVSTISMTDINNGRVNIFLNDKFYIDSILLQSNKNKEYNNLNSRRIASGGKDDF